MTTILISMISLLAACNSQPATPLTPELAAATPAAATPAPGPAAEPSVQKPGVEAPWLPVEDRVVDPQIDEARGLLITGQTAQAIIILDAHIGASFTDADAWFWRAKARQATGDLNKTEQDLRQAVKLAPTWLGARQALADLLVSTRRCAEAVPLLTLPTEAVPQAGQAWTNLGFCKLRADDPDGGLADLRHGCSLGYDRACQQVASAESRGAPPPPPEEDTQPTVE